MKPTCEQDEYDELEPDYSYVTRACESARFPHGGKREGSGRKPKDTSKKVRRTVTLTPHQAEWLDSQKNASEAIRSLIQQAMKKESKNL